MNIYIYTEQVSILKFKDETIKVHISCITTLVSNKTDTVLHIGLSKLTYVVTQTSQSILVMAC